MIDNFANFQVVFADMSLLSIPITFSPYGPCRPNGDIVVWSRTQYPVQALVEQAAVIQEGTWDETKADWRYVCLVNGGAEKHVFWGSQLSRPKYQVGWAISRGEASGEVVYMSIDEDGRLGYGVTWNHEQYEQGCFHWL